MATFDVDNMVWQRQVAGTRNAGRTRVAEKGRITESAMPKVGEPLSKRNGNHPAAADDCAALSGKIIYRDEFVAIAEVGFGFWQLTPLIRADVPVDEVEETPRAVHQQQMAAYFRNSIEIFAVKPANSPNPRTIAAISYLVWTISLCAIMPPLGIIGCALAYVPARTIQFTVLIVALTAVLAKLYHLHDDWRIWQHHQRNGIWQGFMEERLQSITRGMFPENGVDIRYVIDKFNELFLHNLWTYIRFKRRMQRRTIIAVIVELVVLLFAQMRYPISECFSIFLLAAFITFGNFCFWNWYVRSKIYMHALKLSANDVSQSIMQRMSAINNQFHRQYNILQQLQETGEQLDIGDVRNIPDSQLKDGDAFFATQMLIYLAEELKYIELHLFHTMSIGQREQSFLDEAGRIAARAIRFVGFLPLFALLAYWLVLSGRGNFNFDGMDALEGSEALLVSLISIGIGWLSYSFKGWNSGADILRKQFETASVAGWQTFAKLKFDERLAGRSERAMHRIRHLDNKTGLGGGVLPKNGKAIAQ